MTFLLTVHPQTALARFAHPQTGGLNFLKIDDAFNDDRLTREAFDETVTADVSILTVSL